MFTPAKSLWLFGVLLFGGLAALAVIGAVSHPLSNVAYRVACSLVAIGAIGICANFLKR